MSRNMKIALVVGGLALVGVAIWLLTRRDAAGNSLLSGSERAPGRASTVVAGLGDALTRLGTTIADAADPAPEPVAPDTGGAA